ncbi:MAG: hypothetical protein IPK55_10830 [Streptococcus sp.]|nr:hypothetical protein [Streptococcus sp.]
MKSKTVSVAEGKKFYREHLKDIQVERVTSSQIAVFTEPAIPTKDQPVQLGSLNIVKGTEYTKGRLTSWYFFLWLKMSLKGIHGKQSTI